MKKGIHPPYKPTVIRCACGAEFKVGSAKPNLRVEICSHCHPFFLGTDQQKFIAGGRIEQFRKKYGKK